MTTMEQLDIRALRMLIDRRKHAPAALEWARERTQCINARLPDLMDGFTLRELSLGAGEVYA